MELTPDQEKKLKKLSQLDSNGQVVILESIEEYTQEITDKLSTTEQSLSDKLDTVVQAISSIEIPEQVKHDQEFKALMDKIEEPLEVTVELNVI